jgi:hypothetical protein
MSINAASQTTTSLVDQTSETPFYIPAGVVTVTEWLRLGWCGSFR